MKTLAVTLATRDYDSVHPLALRDVVPDGIDLTLIRSFDALERVEPEPSIDGGEASFSQYLRRIAAGDRTLVGLPAFVMREFRHRCLFVRRGSGLTDVTHLAGHRVGVDAWAATGNVWTRALVRERGVSLEQVRWMVGPVNRGEPPASADGLPRGVEVAPPGRALGELLAAGELDAVMCPWPPAGSIGRAARSSVSTLTTGLPSETTTAGPGSSRPSIWSCSSARLSSDIPRSSPACTPP
jgi:4,5-dihydroxyphthalate decarboxylase